MGDTMEQKGVQDDADHGFGDVEALFVVMHQAAPAHHPSEDSLDDPASWQDHEAWLAVDPSDDFDDEVEEGALLHESSAVIGAVSEQVLQPRPAFADGAEDRLGSRGIGDVGGGEVDHQQRSVGIDGDMALAAGDLLARIVAAFLGIWRLDRLAVEDARRRARLPAGPPPIRHQGTIMDGAAQRLSHESAKLPVDRLPGRKIAGERLPTTTRTTQIADDIHDLSQIGRARPSPLRRSKKQRRNHRPLFVGHIRPIAFQLLSDPGHAAARLGCPHGKLES